MAPMGIDLEQRNEDERARMHLWMRQNEASSLAPALRPAEAPAAIVEDIDIEAARTPTGAQAPSRAPLDAFDESQQRRRRYMCLQEQHCVEIGRLSSRPERRRVVDVRRGEDAEAGARQLALRAA